MSSEQQAAMELAGHGGCPHDRQNGAKKAWRVARAVYLVLVKGLGKHQPKLAALGVHLHQMMSSKHGLDDLREHPALTYLSSMSCRSVDPAAAVHPYPRGGHGGAAARRHRSSGTLGGASGLSSMSCRSMDPAAAVSQYQYRPREVEFSCSSTPLHKRRRAQRRLQLQHGGAAEGHDLSSGGEYGSVATVSRLFEIMDVQEAAEATDGDDDDADGDLVDGVVPLPAAVVPAPRQVRITDSPFPAWEDDDDDDGRLGVVDRRADEFIMWFHEQLRMQQQRTAAAAAANRERSTSYFLVK
ncbi:hypothetical protein GUJ93_ZPchr0005g15257 [Zizania palustris]|uniref:Uncharacterized protein n=1 Tax=Zizania palustris TaxID=103762 RepID=A0A8J5SLB0_ZIZPA|nr:hypothetical protein GUJ93_ZPchr0005g15257 [Zizania palustris]